MTCRLHCLAFLTLERQHRQSCTLHHMMDCSANILTPGGCFLGHPFSSPGFVEKTSKTRQQNTTTAQQKRFLLSTQLQDKQTQCCFFQSCPPSVFSHLLAADFLLSQVNTPAIQSPQDLFPHQSSRFTSNLAKSSNQFTSHLTEHDGASLDPSFAIVHCPAVHRGAAHFDNSAVTISDILISFAKSLQQQTDIQQHPTS